MIVSHLILISAGTLGRCLHHFAGWALLSLLSGKACSPLSYPNWLLFCSACLEVCKFASNWANFNFSAILGVSGPRPILKFCRRTGRDNLGFCDWIPDI
jgi:hypothetical protein